MDIDIVSFPLWYVVFLFSLTCHEAAHALAAKWGGDLTAYHAGQVTLNPLPHIQREPWGTVLIPILSFLMSNGGSMIGWGSAPYDPFWEQRHPRRAAWMALAGPAANVLLIIIAGILLRLGRSNGWFNVAPSLSSGIDLSGGVAAFLSLLFILNTLLAFFNMLPVPPLDGNSAITLLMPEAMADKFREFSRQPFLQMFGILIAWFFFSPQFPRVLSFVTNIFLPPMGMGSGL